MADLIVAKHRNGATRNVKLVFQGHLSRFANNPDAGYGPDGSPVDTRGGGGRGR